MNNTPEFVNKYIQSITNFEQQYKIIASKINYELLHDSKSTVINGGNPSSISEVFSNLKSAQTSKEKLGRIGL